ncbi:SOS response-associated peptidase family protein [Kribbella sp. NPDC000426]|uniref:SOS response-associated peptidase family protein n=1 Tax=Kribbella sp. NPDC000426 TaxID=3154255 RepID=UPI003330B53A
MCGRYASVAGRADLLERFAVDEGNADELRGQDFNVTSTKGNPVVIARVPQDAGEDAEPARELRAFRWGLLPFWAKDLKVGARILCTSQLGRCAAGSRVFVGCCRGPVGTCEPRESRCRVRSAIHLENVEAIGGGSLACDEKTGTVLPHSHVRRSRMWLVTSLSDGARFSRPSHADLYDIPLF